MPKLFSAFQEQDKPEDVQSSVTAVTICLLNDTRGCHWTMAPLSELMVIKQLQATVVVMWRCINKIELN